MTEHNTVDQVTHNNILLAIIIPAGFHSDGIEFFITPRWFYYKDPYFKKYLDQCFDSPRIFPRLPDSGIPPILVYQRRVDLPTCGVHSL